MKAHRPCEFRTGLRPTPMDETVGLPLTPRMKRDAYNSRSHPVMAGLVQPCPGHPRRPIAGRFHILLAPERLSIWAVCKLNHVDGRDKPAVTENDMEIGD